MQLSAWSEGNNSLSLAVSIMRRRKKLPGKMQFVFLFIDSPAWENEICFFFLDCPAHRSGD